MKPRKPGNIFRIWDRRNEQYLSIGYSNKTTWRRLTAAIDAAKHEVKLYKKSAVDLEIHEFPVQQTPSAIHRVEE